MKAYIPHLMALSVLSIVTGIMAVFMNTAHAQGTMNVSVNVFGPTEGVAGERIEFTVFAKNIGPSDAKAVRVTVSIPQFFTYTEDDNVKYCERIVNSVSCNLGAMDGGETRVFPLEFEARPSIHQPHRAYCDRDVELQARMSSEGIEPDREDNRSPVIRTFIRCRPRFPVPPRDEVRLQLELSSPPKLSHEDNSFPVSVSTHNGGNTRALHVSVSLPLPQGLIFNEDKSSNYCTLYADQIFCTNFNLERESSRQFLLMFSPKNDLCTRPPNRRKEEEFRPMISLEGSIYSPTLNPGNRDIGANRVEVSVLCPQPEKKKGIEPVDTGITNTSSGENTTGNEIDEQHTNGASTQDGEHVILKNYTTLAASAKSVHTQGTPNNGGSYNPNRTSGKDPFFGLNRNSSSNSTGTADLSLFKTGLDVVTPGRFVRYQLILSNAGPATATHVEITDPIPSGLVFVPSASNRRCHWIGTDIVCRRITVQPGQLKYFTITYALQKEFSCEAMKISNLSHVKGLEHDPNLSNNSASFSNEAGGLCAPGGDSGGGLPPNGDTGSNTGGSTGGGGNGDDDCNCSDTIPPKTVDDIRSFLISFGGDLDTGLKDLILKLIGEEDRHDFLIDLIASTVSPSELLDFLAELIGTIVPEDLRADFLIDLVGKLINPKDFPDFLANIIATLVPKDDVPGFLVDLIGKMIDPTDFPEFIATLIASHIPEKDRPALLTDLIGSLLDPSEYKDFMAHLIMGLFPEHEWDDVIEYLIRTLIPESDREAFLEELLKNLLPGDRWRAFLERLLRESGGIAYSSWFLESHSNIAAPSPGQSVVFSITVRNLTLDLATNMRLTHCLDESLDVLDAPGAEKENGCLIWDIDRMDPRATLDVQYRVRVKPTVKPGSIVSTFMTLSDASFTLTDRVYEMIIAERDGQSLPRTGADLLGHRKSAPERSPVHNTETACLRENRDDIS